jgi:hypothetical protein
MKHDSDHLLFVMTSMLDWLIYFTVKCKPSVGGSLSWIFTWLHSPCYLVYIVCHAWLNFQRHTFREATFKTSSIWKGTYYFRMFLCSFRHEEIIIGTYLWPLAFLPFLNQMIIWPLEAKRWPEKWLTSSSCALQRRQSLSKNWFSKLRPREEASRSPPSI